MSSSDSDAYMEEEGPNEYDYEDGFVTPDREDSPEQAESADDDQGEVGERDLTEEELAIYRASQQEGGMRRSRRNRRAVERYQDPDYCRLMSDNGRDALPDDESVMVQQESDDEYQPEVGDFSMDEESEEESDLE